MPFNIFSFKTQSLTAKLSSYVYILLINLYVFSVQQKQVNFGLVTCFFILLEIAVKNYNTKQMSVI